MAAIRALHTHAERRRWRVRAALASAIVCVATGFIRVDASGQVRRDFIPAGDVNVGRLLFAGVGIDEYFSPDLWEGLKNAEGDLTGVWDALRETFRFDSPDGYLLYGPDAKKQRIEGLLDRLGNDLSKNDTLVFFFAGHGKQIPARHEGSPNKFYLAPYDVTEPPENSRSQYMDVDDLLEALGDTQALHVLVIIDACRSDRSAGAPVALGSVAGGSPAGPNIRRHSRRLLVSVSSGQSAADRGTARRGHSRFTGWLLTALDNAVQGRDPSPDVDADYRLTFQALFGFLQRQVREESGGLQVPIEGRFPPGGEGELALSLPVSPFSAAYTRAVELSEEDGRQEEARAAAVEALEKTDVPSLRAAYLRYLAVDLADAGEKPRAESLCDLRAALDHADYANENIHPVNRPSLRRLVKNVSCPNDSAGG